MQGDGPSADCLNIKSRAAFYQVAWLFLLGGISNDFHDMTDDELAFAHENGDVPWTLLIPAGYVPSQPGVMPIKVNVVPIPGAVWLLISRVIAVVGIRKKPSG